MGTYDSNIGRCSSVEMEVVRIISEEATTLLACYLWQETFGTMYADHMSKSVKLAHSFRLQDSSTVYQRVWADRVW